MRVQIRTETFNLMRDLQMVFTVWQISLIDRVHKIYNDTTWQDRQEQDGFKGMGFVIKKIVVHSDPNKVRGGEAHYNMVREKWDVRNLLEVRAPYWKECVTFRKCEKACRLWACLCSVWKLLLLPDCLFIGPFNLIARIFYFVVYWYWYLEKLSGGISFAVREFKET